MGRDGSPSRPARSAVAPYHRSLMRKLFTKIVDAKPDEIRALLLAFVFNFVVLGGYYVIRPIRDEIGADRGVENLPWMYTGTLIGMLIANALYATIVARMSRRRFIPIAYRFAIANLFVFFLLMRWMPAARERAILAPIFFIWVSVFNLFATTMFWSFMVDVFTPEQGKRLFGFIAVGGSIGGIVGGFVTSLAVFLMVYTLRNTWAYFQQADLTQHQLQDRAARTSFLANIDIAVNTITVLIQVFLTGRLMKWFGVGITLVLMPLLSAVGFAAIGFAPVLTVLAAFQILRRAAGFALLRPAREVLFTVLRREDKYKAKSLIDTFGYRFGDQIGAWSYPLMRWFGLGLVGISWVAVPFGAIWCVLGIWLGRKQRQLAEAKRDQTTALPHTAAPEAA